MTPAKYRMLLRYPKQVLRCKSTCFFIHSPAKEASLVSHLHKLYFAFKITFTGPSNPDGNKGESAL